MTPKNFPGSARSKLHFIVPAIDWSDGLKETLSSITRVAPSRRGRLVIIAPAHRLPDIGAKARSLPDGAASNLEFVEESARGVYPAFNDGLRELAGEQGYVVFLGAGDVLHPPAPELCHAMDKGAALICVPVAGDKATLRRRFGWLTCLPNPQGCIYNLALGSLIRYDERLRIYDDVLQRIAIIQQYGCVKLDCDPLIRIDGHGVSGAQNLRKVREHFRERISLMLPILRHKEPVLAVKYVVGSFAMLVRYLSRSTFTTSGNSV